VLCARSTTVASKNWSCVSYARRRLRSSRTPARRDCLDWRASRTQHMGHAKGGGDGGPSARCENLQWAGRSQQYRRPWLPPEPLDGCLHPADIAQDVRSKRDGVDCQAVAHGRHVEALDGGRVNLRLRRCPQSSLTPAGAPGGVSQNKHRCWPLHRPLIVDHF